MTTLSLAGSMAPELSAGSAPGGGSSRMRTPLPSISRATRLPSFRVTTRTPSGPTLTSASFAADASACASGAGGAAAPGTPGRLGSAGGFGGWGGFGGAGGEILTPSGVTETITLTRLFGSAVSTMIAGPESNSQLFSIAPAINSSSDKRKNLPQPIDVSQSPNRCAASFSFGAATRAPAATSAAMRDARPWLRPLSVVEFGSALIGG